VDATGLLRALTAIGEPAGSSSTNNTSGMFNGLLTFVPIAFLVSGSMVEPPYRSVLGQLFYYYTVTFADK
jgi:hypothetical protein